MQPETAPTGHVHPTTLGLRSTMGARNTKESWERFRDDILMPTLQAGVEGGFPTPPQETTFEVYNQQP